MNTMTDSDRSILNASTTQLSHSITAVQRKAVSHLYRGKLAAEPAPDGAPSTTDLNAILNNAIDVPSTTSVITVPPKIDNPMAQMLKQVQTLDSYVSLLTAYCVYNEHPDIYDTTIPIEAFAFARAMARWRNYVLTGGVVKAIAGYLPVGTINSQSFTKSVTKGDIHLEFLAELFGGFSLPAAALTQLDSILTNVVAKIGAVKLSFEKQSDSMDHFLTYYHADTVEGTGGDTGIPAMFVFKIRTFYLHVDQSSWAVSIAKSSVKHFKFNMNYFDMDTTMSAGLVAQDQETINKAIEQLTGKTGDEINALMNMQAIQVKPGNA